MASVLRTFLEDVLGPRIKKLKDSKEQNHLIDLPKRFNVKIFDDPTTYKLIEAMLKVNDDALMSDKVRMEAIIAEIDKGCAHMISGLALKYEQDEFYRQESDKLRLLWGYFDKRSGSNKFTHSTSLGRLKMFRQARDKMAQSANEAKTRALPCYPEVCMSNCAPHSPPAADPAWCART